MQRRFSSKSSLQRAYWEEHAAVAAAVAGEGSNCSEAAAVARP